jgi:hypothetical protein
VPSLGYTPGYHAADCRCAADGHSTNPLEKKKEKKKISPMVVRYSEPLYDRDHLFLYRPSGLMGKMGAKEEEEEDS